MSRAIRIASIYPEALNLNGDQANLTVLKKQLEWARIDVEVIALDDALAVWPDDVDFLLIGHGSQAAWKQILPKLVARQDWLKRLIAGGVPGLAVGSGQEVLYGSVDNEQEGLGLIYRVLASTERQSRFVIADLDGIEVLGYLNRATDAPAIERLGSFILTGLHGPVLAKNETLLRLILTEIARRAGVAFNANASSEKSSRASKAVAQVWELEAALASE